ncbi:unnamed protein product [Linum trigynum]|uniref:Tf2-1-like SH3-like domain-containing protein n=1 Tax=Linum trigynum TaxID=586398 RepID=A0AAV2F5U5_9ROSI
MKQLVDGTRREEEFEVGDLVLLLLHLYRQTSVFRCSYQKLAARYFGPYMVIEKVNPVAYRLHLPAEAAIHATFHVFLLKWYRGSANQEETTAPPMFVDGDLELEPLEVLDTKWVRRGGRLRETSLVRWRHGSPEDATWEDTETSHQTYPTFDIEDHVVSEGGRDDRNSVEGGSVE